MSKGEQYSCRKNQEKNTSKKGMKYFSFAGTSKNEEKNNSKKGMQYFSLQELARIKKIIILEKEGNTFL